MNTVTNYCEGVKYKIPHKFSHILPILGSFHIEMSFMIVMYKRLKESKIEDLLAEAGLITQGSIVQALVAVIIIQQQGYAGYFTKIHLIYS